MANRGREFKGKTVRSKGVGVGKETVDRRHE